MYAYPEPQAASDALWLLGLDDGSWRWGRGAARPATGPALPAACRASLARVGHGAGGFVRGSDFRCAALFRLRERADDVLAEGGVPSARGRARRIPSLYRPEGVIPRDRGSIGPWAGETI